MQNSGWASSHVPDVHILWVSTMQKLYEDFASCLDRCTFFFVSLCVPSFGLKFTHCLFGKWFFNVMDSLHCVISIVSSFKRSFINFKKKVEINSLKTDKHLPKEKNKGEKKRKKTCHFVFPAQQHKGTTAQNWWMALSRLHRKKLYVLDKKHLLYRSSMLTHECKQKYIYWLY